MLATPSLPLRDPRLARLERLGRTLAFATGLVVVLLVAIGLGLWLKASWVENVIVPRVGLAHAPVAVTPLVQMLGLLITAVPLAILAYGLLEVRRIFCDFADGELITPALAPRLERFGAAVTLQALLNPVAGALLSVLLTLGNPPGQRMLALSLPSHDVVSVLVGLLIIAIGSVMREAARIAEEHASFV